MPANLFEQLEQNNARMVELLAKNKSVSGFVASVVDHCVEYAQRKGIRPEDVVIDTPFVEGYDGFTEYFRARISHR